MKFSGMLLFMTLWLLVVYLPMAHMVWGKGGLLGAISGSIPSFDFAGGTVVHITSGVSALVCALYLGKRNGYPHESMRPHNLVLSTVGACLLWVGWFGFNAGSALGANSIAVVAFLSTHTAAVTAALAWMAIEWVHRGAPTVLGLASGVVAGLATVTPGAGYVGPFSAMFIGLAAGALSYAAIMNKGKLGYDDSLDVVGIHGVGGIFGVLATGVLASKAINPGGADGLLSGNPGFLGVQALAVLAVALFAGLGTYLILKLVNRLVGLRISPEEERMGLDLSQHNERAYS
jgi:Amt family ammonium transporter